MSTQLRGEEDAECESVQKVTRAEQTADRTQREAGGLFEKLGNVLSESERAWRSCEGMEMKDKWWVRAGGEMNGLIMIQIEGRRRWLERFVRRCISKI